MQSQAESIYQHSLFLAETGETVAYRNGTYVAFHAEGKTDPLASDIRYFRIMTAWGANKKIPFRMINSHDKAGAVKDSSKAETLARSLRLRLASSRNMVLIIGQTTWMDADWVPFEIRLAVDIFKIPIIAAYPGRGAIYDAYLTAPLWPPALRQRILNKTAHVIHVPFKREPIADAIDQFDHDNFPKGGGLGCYSPETYASWNIQ